jgi:poly(3-hydroxybutyrate) depolymerase
MKLRNAIVAVLLLVFVPAPALPQALTSLASVRVAYTTRKNTVKPQGELKAQLDALEAQVAEAARLGRTGEVRRLYAKGMTLLAGRAWTDAADFGASLVLRTDHVVADSSKPFVVRLEQIYTPSIELRAPITAHIVLRKRPTPGTGGAPAQPGEVVKDLGTFDGVSRDLRESPFPFELDVRGVADGPYALAVEVSAAPAPSEPALRQAQGERVEGTPLGGSSLNIALRNGLDEQIARLEASAKTASEDVRAEILFPIDRMTNVNRGRLEARTFDVDKDLALAEAAAAAAKAGQDPFAGRTGDFKRHYMLDAAREIMPYRMYVPRAYTGAKAFPLIVALHGLGGTEDSFFDNYNKALPPLAEQHGYILATPLGYRVDGSYGWGLGTPPADPAVRRTQDLSEQDVMQVLQRVRQLYKIDENRIYLMGHSMGGLGTWKIAPKYPDIWAAIATFAGAGAPATLERIRHVPEIVVHGDADPTVNVSGSRNMVAKLKELGVEHKYIEVPGGLHSDVVAPNLPAVIDFFNKHPKASKTTSQP